MFKRAVHSGGQDAVVLTTGRHVPPALAVAMVQNMHWEGEGVGEAATKRLWHLLQRTGIMLVLNHAETYVLLFQPSNARFDGEGKVVGAGRRGAGGGGQASG
jgi:hypothetical protein